MTRYFQAEKMAADDLGVPFTGEEGEVVYDARTLSGQWATLKECSFRTYTTGKLGTGFGQKYVRNAAGEFHKVEG